MALFRIETAFDPKIGLFYAELYYPDDATVPQARTGSIYPSQVAAEQDALKMVVDVFGKDAHVVGKSSA